MKKEELIKELENLNINTNSKFRPAKHEIAVFQQLIKKLREKPKTITQAIPALIKVHPKNDQV